MVTHQFQAFDPRIIENMYTMGDTNTNEFQSVISNLTKIATSVRSFTDMESTDFCRTVLI